MQRTISTSLKISLLISSLILPFAAFAQTSGQPKIHLHETPPPLQVTTAGGAVGLSLQPSFSLLDGEDQVLMAFEIIDATIEIEENPKPLSFKKPKSPGPSFTWLIPSKPLVIF